MAPSRRKTTPAPSGLGLRLPNATEADIEQAIADRTIVRTWPMRRTLHFVAAADVRWMLALTASRADAGFAPRYRQLELDERAFGLAQKVLIKALSGGKRLTRQALYRFLEEAGISLEGGGRLDSGQTRGLHILAHHAQTGLICYGPHQGKQPAFVLLDEWVPKSRTLSRDEALAELATRYFTSHGPATLQDFTWWSALTVRDAKLGIELTGEAIVQEVIDGRTYWLPASEPPYMRHRGCTCCRRLTNSQSRTKIAVLLSHRSMHRWRAAGECSGRLSWVDGRVVGTWKASVKKGVTAVTPMPFDEFHPAARHELESAAERYGSFLGTSVTVA